MSRSAVAWLLVTALFAGCSGDSSSSRTPARGALTEADFVANPALRGTPDRGVVFAYLERAGETSGIDVAGIGTDTLPFVYDRAVTHTFCWPHKEVAGHSLHVRASDVTLAEVAVNQPCVTARMAPGAASFVLHHDAVTPSGVAVFLVPRSASTSGTATAAAAAVDGDAATEAVTTTIQTGQCVGCDLTGASFHGANLRGVDLTGADLSDADLSDANLDDANLSRANLENANLQGASLNGTVFDGSAALVDLVSQSAVADAIPDDVDEADRLAHARSYAYGAQWIASLEAPGQDASVVSIVSLDGTASAPVATFAIAETIADTTHTLTLTRTAGSYAAENLIVSATSASSGAELPVTPLFESEESVAFVFTADAAGCCAQFSLRAPGFDVLTEEQANFSYAQPAPKPVTSFASSVSPLPSRTEPFAVEKIGDPSGAARTLNAHVTALLTTLFANEARAHMFTVSVAGVVDIAGFAASVPILLVPPVSSATLDQVVPEMAAAILSYYGQNAPTFDRLVFDVTVFRDDAVALLHLPNVSLATTAVTDLPQASALRR